MPVHQIDGWLTENGMIRSRDLAKMGVGREYLRIMMHRGELVRLSRGIYVRPDAALSQFSTLALVARRVPKGVVCLLSALAYHQMGTSLPAVVWLAVGTKASKPQLDYPKLHLVRASPLALLLGVDQHLIDGVSVPITSPARTVVDCFRYRSTVGLDVALEALREGLRPRLNIDGHKLPPLCTRSEIYEYSTMLRIRTVIRPYLEAYSAQ